MRLLTVITIVGVMGMLACSTTKATHANKKHYSRDHIYSADIQNNSASNAYDLIKNLRPQWLRARGTKSIKYEQASFPLVYVNESRLGSVNALTTISTEQITEIEFLNSGDATIRFGLNHASGAILITTL
ncbi:MAG: hypothetical protein ACE5HX_03015 [bacterium]